MYFVYILRSRKDGNFYIGSTKDIQERLKRHNGQRVPSTKYRVPFDLVYKEEFTSKGAALTRELELKILKSHKVIEQLIRGKEISG